MKNLLVKEFCKSVHICKKLWWNISVLFFFDLWCN